MWKLIIKRVLLMIPQLLLMTLLVFWLAKFMPGDPFTGKFSPQLDLNQLREMRKAAGLDDPWYVQYVRWIGNVFHGNFGESFVMKKDVTTLIGQRIGNTVMLSIFGLILTYLIGIPMAVAAAKKEGKFIDNFFLTFTSITFGIPAVIVYLFLIFMFGYMLHWFPTTGSVSLSAEGPIQIFLSRIYHVILPATAYALLGTVGIFNYLRVGLLDTRNLDFIKTARAKGVSEKAIFWKHNFRNSVLPLAQGFGYQIVSIFGGAVILETIFNFPGMGQLFTNSVTTNDSAVITTLILFSGFLSLVGAMLSDLILAWVDPRVRIS
ncbi:MAG: ABC transporter permease [Lactobacillaceae bacterium]|jgi:peptide/nickel transport system permease protein|nr:ABC transporter permease [Lactobacillaceae bacterium]